MPRTAVVAVATLLSGSVAGLTGYAGPGGDPADPKVRAGYAGQVALGASRISWPPERDGLC